MPGRFGTGELLPLTTLADGRYVILEKIAQGGMGAIYRAQDKRLRDKVVAVKEMAESAIAPDERERILECFKREAELLARLEHPNLVRVSDLFQEQGRHYMVMEFVPGKTLEKMLEGRSKPFPEDQVLTWAKQLCAVLSYLHSQKPKIIYRDMKPANVMVVDGTDTVKLIDFGIARFFKPGKRRDTIELGTDGYAPPEQYGKSQTDERADVYALGAMLHQLLTMRDPVTVPFKFPLVRSLNPKVSQHVEEAVAKAVQPAVAKRYRSIDEMLVALVGDGAPRVRPARKPAKPTRKPAKPTRKPAKPARKPAKPARKPAKPARQPSRRAPSSVPGKLVPTPASLSFGALVAGGGALNRSLTVTLPAGEGATLRANVPWLHIYPRSVSGSGKVTVMLYPGRLELGRLSLEGVGRWVLWPARFLVPTEQRNQGHVEVESKSGEALVPVSVIARPPGWRVFFGWVFAISLTLGQASIILVILLAILGVLFGSIL